MDIANLLRPKTFDDIVGQDHLCAKDAPLRILTQKGLLGHSFFYGEAGCGKTSLVRVIATVMQLPFYEFNATSLKIEQLRKVFQEYKNTLQKPLIFIDEVHRLAKNQQEVLLPVMEKNSAIIIGVSTSNPFFSLTSAIRSRSMLFELNKIDDESLKLLIEKAHQKVKFSIDADAKEYLIFSSGGDARAMLKLLEFALGVSNSINIDLLKSLKMNATQSGVNQADTHYDLASAMIKSIRGSDADAAIYYLARLINAGESADFIARRLVILASEDIGNANPQALTLCTSTLTSVLKIGFPEARIILAQAVIYLCGSPKSNSAYIAINKALKYVKEEKPLKIPKNITQQNNGYLYPHDFGGYVKQQYLSKELNFVELKSIGYEKKMRNWLKEIKKIG